MEVSASHFLRRSTTTGIFFRGLLFGCRLSVSDDFLRVAVLRFSEVNSSGFGSLQGC